MYRGKRVAVVVRAFNEERLISDALRTLPHFVDFAIVVDDASTDRTAEVATTQGHPGLEVIRHPVNRGVGAATLTGMRRAIELGAEISVSMDGDGQMHPRHLPALLDPLCEGTHDFAKGNRITQMSSWHGMPPTRVLGNLLMSALIKPASGYWHISDPLNGYTAITTRTLQELPLHRIRADYSFETDMLIKLGTIGARVVEIPMPAIYGAEISGIRVGSATAGALCCLGEGMRSRLTSKWRRTIPKRFRTDDRVDDVVHESGGA
jgi:glycosyltransferase involved in cell wall biosynthesis